MVQAPHITVVFMGSYARLPSAIAINVGIDIVRCSGKHPRYMANIFERLLSSKALEIVHHHCPHLGRAAWMGSSDTLFCVPNRQPKEFELDLLHQPRSKGTVSGFQHSLLERAERIRCEERFKSFASASAESLDATLLSLLSPYDPPTILGAEQVVWLHRRGLVPACRSAQQSLWIAAWEHYQATLIAILPDACAPHSFPQHMPPELCQIIVYYCCRLASPSKLSDSSSLRTAHTQSMFN